MERATAEMNSAPDRVCAIMAPVLIEHSLQRAFEAHFEDRSILHTPTGTQELFFAQGAPLGTFKNRILMGWAMGFYDEAVAKDLELIRDIRNQFAHSLLALDFTNEHIVKTCSQIRDYEFAFPEREEVAPSRVVYEKACWHIALDLNRLAFTKMQSIMQKLEDIARENGIEIPTL